MSTRKNKKTAPQVIKSLVNDDGSINLIPFEIDGIKASIVGTETGGRKVSEAIDEVRFATGERRYYTRGELYILEKNKTLKII